MQMKKITLCTLIFSFLKRFWHQEGAWTIVVGFKVVCEVAVEFDETVANDELSLHFLNLCRSRNSSSFSSTLSHSVVRCQPKEKLIAFAITKSNLKCIKCC